jgi:hypothetical protein
MALSASFSSLGSEFDDFLFAAVGEDRNGMLLSVVSALARLDVDPWQEAANLAGLPGETATRRLASMIATLPDRPSAHLDPGTIAARLVALLPRRAGPNIPSRDTLLGVGAVTNSRTTRYVIIYVIFVAVVVGAQSIIASRQPPERVDNDYLPESGAVFSHAPDSPQQGWQQ